MLIKVKNSKTGKIYSNDMSDKNTQCILSINFCTSYTQVEVQDEIDEDGRRTYPTHTIILPPSGVSLKDINWVDLIAIQEDNRGEWIIDNPN